MSKLTENKIFIYNSLKGEKQEFKAIQAPNLGMYVCGPTVYSYVHLGNCRTFLSFDNVVRYFKFLGYNVRYVRNITDAGHLVDDAEEGEDKISKKARLEKLEPMEIVQKYTLDFHKVLEQFNALPPSIEPTATGHILEQIAMIKTIMAKGLAYEVNGSVYFDVKKFNEEGGNYGELSGRDIEELMAGSRALDGQTEKKNPQDFALWKKASPAHIMRWDSPWGEGFPGWHLECSAMGTKYLGDQFDIHGGGMDLKFPHHECEIAQGKACNDVAPVNYWMHANMLTLNGKKMSKSTGNTLLPEELFSGNNNLLEKAYSPMVVRFFMLQAHYRSVLDFSSEALNAAEKGFHKLMNAKKTLNDLQYKAVQVSESEDKRILQLIQDCYSYMNDDFNTPKTMAVLFELVTKINKMAHTKTFDLSDAVYLKMKETFNGFVEEVFGLQDEQVGEEEKLSGVIEILIKIRNQAKQEKNYALSDQIRDELKALGIQLKDSKDGTSFSLI